LENNNLYLFMTRIKRGIMAHKRRKRVIKRAKGYLLARRTKFRAAKEALLKAGVYAYRDRRAKKRAMRGLWQIRLNAAIRKHGLNYSRFMNALKLAKIEINRKVLSEIAMNNPEIFARIVEKAKAAIK